ncbi:uncharacterized protein LOC107871942 [Capsicum annuum]|uniref:uncharacterized protein LOC107871942 n=1 Tax=Capsicum annuum TaxID=4072 RepID=UPI001FB12E1A|nr:uncharacterized protein LOC107871942 [Capsicum annuum]
MTEPRSSMSNFVIGVFGLVFKECRSTMLIANMDLPRLIMHTQQIEAKKRKEREIAYRRARTGHAPAPRNGQELWGKSSMSRSQNSMSGKANHPPCANCGKNHKGEYSWGQKGCYGCGQQGYRIKECPYARRGNRDVHPQTPANSAPALLSRSAPSQGA